MTKFEFSFGSETDRPNDWFFPQFLLVVTVPSHTVLPVPVEIDQDRIESGHG